MLCALLRFSGVSYKGWAHAEVFFSPPLSPQINGVLPASPLVLVDECAASQAGLFLGCRLLRFLCCCIRLGTLCGVELLKWGSPGCGLEGAGPTAHPPPPRTV